MAFLSATTCILFLSIVLAEFNCSFSSQVYVVYMGSATKSGNEVGTNDDALSCDHQMLASVHDGSLQKAQDSHIYSYQESFRGFAAKLTEQQASTLAKMPGVVSVLPNLKRKLHTTHSWDFMGLHTNEGMEIPGYSTKNQENVIIGFIDTVSLDTQALLRPISSKLLQDIKMFSGIWPESPSFHDEGMAPVPSRWKGQCQAGDPSSNFTCNKKIIGARYYLSGYEAEEQKDQKYLVQGEATKSDETIKSKSPRDTLGHGTHTASTAAGRYVRDMSYKGLGAGEGRGGAQMARIAVYKACWEMGCYDADLLAAFDDAIKDGVDIISISLGPDPPQDDYFSDPISIGSFHAVDKSILVISSAGNAGGHGMVTNLAPWLLTIAAGSTDRKFASSVVLGDGTKIMGDSLTRYNMNRSISTISASDASAAYFTPYQSSFCLDSSLNETKVKGKILVCRHGESSSDSRVQKSEIVKRAGASGMILIDETNFQVAAPFVLPATSIDREAGDKIISYLNTTWSPESIILPASTIMGTRSAPRVSAFSSRGPNSLTPLILKPDVVAPGLNILAAWSPAKDARMEFNVQSGTSMACPHVTGIAALVKSVYPTWSPAMIKSAIMTTATILDKKGNTIVSDPEGSPANPFDFGSGFINPTQVLNPGLIFNSSPLDYKSFLCSIGYDDHSLQKITADSSVCTKQGMLASDLNYPSITVPNLKGSYQVTRTVTNVGEPSSVYQVSIDAPKGIKVTVAPNVLAFRSYASSKNFIVNLQVMNPNSQDYIFGSIIWRSNKNVVRVPLTVKIQ